MTWTETKTKQLMLYRRDGFSASEIGTLIDTTKNAVIGKLYRMGELRQGKNAHWPDERRAKFIALWMDYTPVRQIAQKMLMRPFTVHSRRTALGLPTRRELRMQMARKFQSIYPTPPKR